MIDFIKIYTKEKENIENRIKNDFLDTETKCSINYWTKEVTYPCRRYFDNIEVRVSKTSAIVRNSLHKYFNLKTGLGNNNYTDFSYSNIQNALMILEQEIDCDLFEYKITNLEFGLNVTTDSSPKLLLNNQFLMYNYDDFNQKETFQNKGMYKQYNNDSYYVKMYDKGLHYKTEKNIFRFEIKILSNKFLKNKFNISTLKDVLNKANLKLLFDFLLECFEKVSIIDDYTSQMIPPDEKIFIELGKGANYWRELKKRYKSSTSYYNKTKMYNSLLRKYDLCNTKNKIRTLLINKFNQLLIG